MNNILPELRNLINQLGESLAGVTIRATTGICAVNAMYLNGEILVCQEFFNYNRQDQSYIIWHELYHYRNDKALSHNNIYIFDDPYQLNPPANIMQHIDNHLNWYYGGLLIYDAVRNDAYNHLLGVNDLRSPDWYRNEIAAYEAEKLHCTNPSGHYSSEREFLHWKYQECLRLAEIYNK